MLSLWKSKVESDVRLFSSTADRLIGSDRNADSSSHFRTVGSSGKYSRSRIDKHALAAGWDVSDQKSEEVRLREAGLVGQLPLRRTDSLFRMNGP